MLSVLRRATLHVELVTGCSRVPSARCVMDSLRVSHATIAFSVLQMIYMIASPLVVVVVWTTLGGFSYDMCCAQKHCLPISERLEGAVRRPLALGEARGPKRNKSPAGKFEGTLVQVHCPKKGNEAASKSLCLSRSRSLCLSRSQESAAAPLSLLSVSLRWRVQMPYSRSVRSSDIRHEGQRTRVHESILLSVACLPLGPKCLLACACFCQVALSKKAIICTAQQACSRAG